MLIPGLYRHFKNRLYMVVGKVFPVLIVTSSNVVANFVCKNTETNRLTTVYILKNGQLVSKEIEKPSVFYQAMYDEKIYFIREYEIFMSGIDYKKYPEAKQNYRFEKI